MMVIKFRSSEDHSDLMHKVKKMRKFTEELEDILLMADFCLLFQPFPS